MMNYIQPDVLSDASIQFWFVGWSFGNIENSMELAPTGDKYQPKNGLKICQSSWTYGIYKETADIQTSDMLDLPACTRS